MKKILFILMFLLCACNNSSSLKYGTYKMINSPDNVPIIITFDKQLSLDDIAKNCFISVNQLCHLFKKYLATTVSKYITSRRITEAKKYLREGKSVTETAFACGFNNYAHFIKTFKKAVGVPPGKYKGQQQ